MVSQGSPGHRLDKAEKVFITDIFWGTLNLFFWWNFLLCLVHWKKSQHETLRMFTEWLHKFSFQLRQTIWSQHRMSSGVSAVNWEVFARKLPPKIHALKYHSCFCTEFSCTPQPRDIQRRSVCSLLSFVLQVMFKWNFHTGSRLTKKNSYTLRKKLAYFLSQFFCWLVEDMGDIKEHCQVLFAPKFRSHSRVKRAKYLEPPPTSQI